MRHHLLVALYFHAVAQCHRFSNSLKSTHHRRATASVSTHAHVAAECAEKLQTERLASLTRLAAKFGHAAIDTIENVVIARLAENEMELHVLSCEHDRCVQLLLPISFPQQCSFDKDFDECVLQNVQVLDEDGTAQVADAETFTSAKLMTYFEQASKPDWWVEPSDGELVHACGDARDVLNAVDFQMDLVALTSRLAPGATAARVEACGPAGLIIAASDTHLSRRLVEYRFQTICSTAAELRNALLAAVAAGVVDVPVTAAAPELDGRYDAVVVEGLDQFVSQHQGARQVADLFASPITINSVDTGLRIANHHSVLDLDFDRTTLTTTPQGLAANVKLVKEDDTTFLIDVRLKDHATAPPFVATLTLLSDQLLLQIFPQHTHENKRDPQSFPHVFTAKLAKMSSAV